MLAFVYLLAAISATGNAEGVAPQITPPPTPILAPPPPPSAPLSPVPHVEDKLVGKERRVAAAGDVGAWVTTDDYPAIALRQELVGVSALRLAISAKGKVTKCEITSSSGSDVLDTTACAKITERAQFTPALDSKGRAIESTFYKSVRWQIPNNLPIPIPKPSQFTFVYTIEKDGSVSSCKAEPSELNDEGPCSDLQSFEPGLDSKGKPTRKRVIVSGVIRVIDIGDDTSAKQ